MAYNGWMTLGGNEVINVGRTYAYLQNMLPMLGVRDVYSTTDLATALLDQPYSTPLIDEAPWTDPDIPETYGFAGLYPLSITGLQDSTISARIVQNTGAGGVVQRPRRTTREVRVSGLLMGVDDAAVDAGFTWLKSVLNGAGCNDFGCTGDDLCFMASTPYFEPLAAYGDLIDHPVQLGTLRAQGASHLAGGMYSSTGPDGILVGQRQEGVPRDQLTYTWDLEQPPASFGAGTVYPSGTLFPGALTFPGSPPGTLPPGVAVLAGVYDEQGMIAYTTSDTSAGTISITVDTSKGDYFYPVLKIANGTAVVIKSLTATHREIATVDQCIEPSLRTLYDVTCVDGPRVVEEFTPSNGAMTRIEFTLVAGVPYIYGEKKLVASGDGDEIAQYLPGADVFKMETLPLCPAEVVVPPVYDPQRPIPPAPPKPPSLQVPADILDYNSFAITIPGDAVPLWSDVVPTLTITTGAREARNVRVRMVPRPLERFGQRPEDLDPCSACDSFFISYLPKNSVITIDGARERITIEQAGGRVSTAHHLVLAANGGPFAWSTLSCGTGYFLVVDIPFTNAVEATLALTGRQ